MTTQSNQTNLKSQVHIRSATEADVPFIFNSWLKSYRNASSCKSISNPVYYDFQHKIIEKLLARCQVLVACDVTDPTQVFGYLVIETIETVPVLHYAYVKYSFRGIGICKMLLNEVKLDKNTGGFYTHETHSGLKLLEKSKFIYNPYLVNTL